MSVKIRYTTMCIIAFLSLLINFVMILMQNINYRHFYYMNIDKEILPQIVHTSRELLIQAYYVSSFAINMVIALFIVLEALRLKCELKTGMDAVMEKPE